MQLKECSMIRQSKRIQIYANTNLMQSKVFIAKHRVNATSPCLF